MILFLTSSPGGNYILDDTGYPCKLDSSNGFCEMLKDRLPDRARCLMIAAYPDELTENDRRFAIMEKAFELTGIELGGFVGCDRRNCHKLSALVAEADLIILSGGHVPTENVFFTEIGLADTLKAYQGIIIGISAGTMNCADMVYAAPELEGESIDPKYERYISGLGLTDINILPHYQYLKNVILDGRLMVDDIAREDSYTKAFYALVDGAFILLENNNRTIYGEAYYYSNGECTQICKDGMTLSI